MLGKLKLTYDEVENRPWGVVKKIEKIIRGEEKENKVKFDYVNASGASWRVRFGGISIETDDINYKTVHRRVKVVFIKDSREYDIDLDKIKEKYEEVKKLALEFEATRKRIAEQREENENLITKLKGDAEHINIKGSGECFVVEIWSLNEEKVKKVVKFVKTLKE